MADEPTEGCGCGTEIDHVHPWWQPLVMLVILVVALIVAYPYVKLRDLYRLLKK
jgi:hypothetical protein